MMILFYGNWLSFWNLVVGCGGRWHCFFFSLCFFYSVCFYLLYTLQVGVSAVFIHLQIRLFVMKLAVQLSFSYHQKPQRRSDLAPNLNKLTTWPQTSELRQYNGKRIENRQNSSQAGNLTEKNIFLLLSCVMKEKKMLS